MGVTVHCDGSCNKPVENLAETTTFIKCGNRAAHGRVPTYHTYAEVKACFAARWGKN